VKSKGKKEKKKTNEIRREQATNERLREGDLRSRGTIKGRSSTVPFIFIFQL